MCVCEQNRALNPTASKHGPAAELQTVSLCLRLVLARLFLGACVRSCLSPCLNARMCAQDCACMWIRLEMSKKKILKQEIC